MLTVFYWNKVYYTGAWIQDVTSCHTKSYLPLIGKTNSWTGQVLKKVPLFSVFVLILPLQNSGNVK